MFHRIVISLGVMLMAILSHAADPIRPMLRDSVLTLPATLKSIGSYAYADREDIREIVVGSGLIIGEYAFIGCTNLRKVSFSGPVTLEAGAFRDCIHLEEVSIPEGLTQLPYALFYGCEGLKRVKLPLSLRKIGAHCFAYSGLMEITFPNELLEISSNAFSRCEHLREIVLPGKLRLLDSYAFSDCTSLELITLPGNNRRLGELILSGCRALKEIREPSTGVPEFECESYLLEPDEPAYDEIQLFVPALSIERYHRAHGWRLFRHILPI